MVLQRHSRQLRNPQLKDQQTICLSKKVPVGWRALYFILFIVLIFSSIMAAHWASPGFW